MYNGVLVEALYIIPMIFLYMVVVFAIMRVRLQIKESKNVKKDKIRNSYNQSVYIFMAAAGMTIFFASITGLQMTQIEHLTEDKTEELYEKIDETKDEYELEKGKRSNSYTKVFKDDVTADLRVTKEDSEKKRIYKLTEYKIKKGKESWLYEDRFTKRTIYE